MPSLAAGAAAGAAATAAATAGAAAGAVAGATTAGGASRRCKCLGAAVDANSEGTVWKQGTVYEKGCEGEEGFKWFSGVLPQA